MEATKPVRVTDITEKLNEMQEKWGTRKTEERQQQNRQMKLSNGVDTYECPPPKTENEVQWCDREKIMLVSKWDKIEKNSFFLRKYNQDRKQGHASLDLIVTYNYFLEASLFVLNLPILLLL